MPNATGTYEEIDGRPVVRFERTFPHAVDTVWEAITQSARLEAWFPTTVEFEELRAGAPIVFRFAEDAYPSMTGEFREVDRPRRLSFTWGDDVLTFELAERDGGTACRLSLNVELDSADKAARDAAGWDDCLDMLAMAASGESAPRPFRSGNWQARYDQYKRQGFPANAPIPQ
jgi:uncharacterized protein YndB with AHSA1/START domain